MTDLLLARWGAIDTHDLRLLLDERIGGPGQYDGSDNRLYLPLARSACKVVLTYRGAEIVALSPGPAFDAEQWRQVELDIDTLVRAEPRRVGRDYSFSTYRVTGSWLGTSSGLQILPAPPGTPQAPCEMADHAFMLEFPFPWTGIYRIDNSRRIREHRRLTLVLNLLLPGHTSFQSPRPQHLWTAAPDKFPACDVTWAQSFFFGPLGEIWSDSLSESAASPILSLPAETYYNEMRHDGRSLMVPDDLDASLGRYLALSRPQGQRLERAAYWLDLAARQWDISVSASYASLVSAVESLIEQGSKHSVYCTECGEDRSHDFPGATAQFRNFFESHAPGASQSKRRNEMYSLRSNILHGSTLMQVDLETAFGWDPPAQRERDLHDELWGLTRLAVRNWLKSQPPEAQ